MSSQNNESGAAAMAIGFVVAGMAMMAIFMFAVLAFLALVFTLLAFCVWNRPLTMFRHTLYPAEARAFVGRGPLGTFLLPAFVVFCEVMFEGRFPWELYGHYVVIAGYTFGSVGVEIMKAENGTHSLDVDIYDPPVAAPPARLPQAPRAIAAPPKPAEPFRYASWDDEEEFK